MNSLAYLFRQFDVLASPKQPASAVIQPTSSHKSPKSSLQRVNAWSSKPFLLSPNQQTLPSKSRRSSSFPSTNFNHYQRKIINNSSPTMASISLSPPSASDTHIDRQIYFLRIFLLVWDSFRSVWSNIVASLLKRNTKSRSRTSLEEKESSEEEVDDPLVTRYNPETANAELDIPAQFTLRIGAHQQPAVHHHLLTKPDVFVHEVDSSISTQDQLSTEASSRSATPILRARKSAFHLPKTLVLDLDETLIHSTSRPMKYGSSSNFFGLGTWGRRNKGGGHTVEVFLGGRSTLYHVYKRPFVDFFLRTVRIHTSNWFLDLSAHATTCRFPDGTRLSYLPPLCGSTRTQLLIGLTLGGEFWRTVCLETYVIIRLLSFFTLGW